MDSYDFRPSKLKPLLVLHILICTHSLCNYNLRIYPTRLRYNRHHWQILPPSSMANSQARQAKRGVSSCQNSNIWISKQWLIFNSTKIHAMTFSCHFRIQMLNISKTVIFHELSRIDTYQNRYMVWSMPHGSYSLYDKGHNLCVINNGSRSNNF